MATGGENAAFALIAELGLSLTQVKTLHLLNEQDDPLSVGEVSEQLGVSVPAASRTVDGLLRKGWLERREDCLLYTSPSPRDGLLSRMPSSA